MKCLVFYIVFSTISRISEAQLHLPPERKQWAWEDGIIPVEKLQGSIRYIKLSVLYPQSDSINYTNETLFDRFGATLSTTFKKDSQILTYSNKYDSMGRLLLNSANFGLGLARDSIVYDDLSRIIKRWRKQDGRYEKIIYYFNHSGDLIKSEIYNAADSSPSWILRYTYDSKQRLISEDNLNVGKIGVSVTLNNETAKSIFEDTHFLYEYEESKVKDIKRTFEKKNTSLNLIEELIVYHLSRTRVCHIMKIRRGLQRTDSLVVTKDGYELWNLYPKSMGMLSQCRYMDRSFNVLKRVSFKEPENYITHYEYLFDERGNWIDELWINDKGQILSHRKRQIEYFD